MSKKIDLLLKSLGVENTEEAVSSLLSDDDNNDIVDTLLKQAQSYAKPFLEPEFNNKLNEDRKTYKGKYFKDALNKANKTFGNVLTSKEIDEIFNDPKNDGNTLDVAIEAIKEKYSSKTGATESEMQKMLDSANQKLQEYEKSIPELESKYKTQYEQAIHDFKLDGVVSTKLVEFLQGKTNIDPVKAANLLKGQLSQRAKLKLKEDNNIALYDLLNDSTPLKKNETTLQTFDGLVDGLIDEFGLRKTGEDPRRQPLPNNGNEPTPKETSATGLAAKFSQVATV